MATNTYVALDKKTVDGTVSTITFSSIPATYTDLVIVSNYGNDSAGNYAIRVGNGSVDTGSNYSRTCFYGTGSAPGSFPESNQTYLNLGNSNTSITCNSITQFNNYANTTTFKSFLDRSNATSATLSLNACLWRSTNAINTIQLFSPTSSNFLAGSTFSLYGIKATATGTGTAKATGGTISYDSFGYVYHTFTSTATFTPSQTLNADILVVAGGGGGGGTVGGGGGAGGLLGFTSQSLTATGYTCSVGAGGTGSTTNTNSGGNGVTSYFGALTAAVGGGGGVGIDGGTGATGGSGGASSGLSGTAGNGTSGQGNNGGAGAGQLGGGGGGAGAVGNGYAGYGAGGVGSSAYTAWGIVTGQGQNVSGTYYFAGGGGGGTNNAAGGNADTTLNVGGYGGGGRGQTSTGPGIASGTANTGGGGGGGRGNGSYAGASGGSGIIIVKYYGL
jgi:hypothetical protein